MKPSHAKIAAAVAIAARATSRQTQAREVTGPAVDISPQVLSLLNVTKLKISNSTLLTSQVRKVHPDPASSLNAICVESLIQV